MYNEITIFRRKKKNNYRPLEQDMAPRQSDYHHQQQQQRQK